MACARRSVRKQAFVKTGRQSTDQDIRYLLDELRVSGDHKALGTALPGAATVREAGDVTEDERLHQMINELRWLRSRCEPTSNQNPRYLGYSNAVSTLRWIIDDLAKERAGQG